MFHLKLLLLFLSSVVIISSVESNSLPVEKLVRSVLLRRQRQVDSDENKVAKNETKVDWEEIERNWDVALEDEVVKKKWEKLQNGLQKGVRGVLRSLFPRMVSMSSDTKVSGNCSAGIFRWLISLRHLKDWSVKMIDAVGKPAPGLLTGSATMFGNYHECLGIRAMDDDDEDVFEDEDEDEEDGGKSKDEESEMSKEFFRGQYCVLEFKPWLPKKPPFFSIDTKLKALERPPKDDSIFRELTEIAVFLNFVPMRFDLCVPSLCSMNDLQKIVNFISKRVDIRGKVVRCEVEESVFHSISVMQAGTLICSFLVLLTLGMISVIGCFLRWVRRPSPLIRYLLSLSWNYSWKELTSDESYKSKQILAPLYGLRTIVLVYIIVVHTCIEVNFQFFRDVLWIRDVAISKPGQLLTKSAYLFDVLILITAFTMSYKVNKKGSFAGVKYLIKKYFRVTPTVMIAANIMILLPLLKKVLRAGPTWSDFIPGPSKACEDNSLYNLVYAQNFLQPKEMCLRNTWIFCVEMQLTLLFIPLLAIGKKFPKLVFTLVVAIFIIIGNIANIVTVTNYKLPPSLLWTLPDPSQRDYYYTVHYYKPWSHLSVFAIGTIAGHLSYNRRKSSRDRVPLRYQFYHFIGWAVCLLTYTCLIFANYKWVKGIFPTPLVSGLFDGFNRILLSFATSWILFRIVANSEENRNYTLVSILSHRILILLGRLTLVAYTVHPIVQLIFLGTQQSQLFSSTIIVIYSLLGNVITTYIIAFIIALLVEIPISAALKARNPSYSHFKDNLNGNFTSKNTFTVNSISVNGDIELSKNG